MMQEILDIIHKTIYQFFDVCEDDKEVPMSDKDKLLLEVNKAICNNLKALEQEPSVEPEMPSYVAEIEAEYKKWINIPYIRKPLAKALYEVWKKHDREDAERR